MNALSQVPVYTLQNSTQLSPTMGQNSSEIRKQKKQKQKKRITGKCINIENSNMPTAQIKYSTPVELDYS